MENLLLCRICLANDVRLCSIASGLRDMYETITSMTFETEDGRPLLICYICYARLQNCYRLQMSCFRSEELLTEIIQCVSSGVLKPQDVLSANSFGVASVLHLSLGHENEDSTECHVKEEVLEVFYDAEPEGMTKNQEQTKLNNKNLCRVKDQDQEDDIINKEPDYEETDVKEVKLEIEDTILEENAASSANILLPSEDNMCPKLFLERIDLNDPRTGVSVVKKLAETDSHLVTDSEDNIRKLTAASNVHKSIDEVGVTLPIHSDDKGMVHYECHTCARTYKNRSSFRKHMYIHTDEKQFECDVCNKFFKSKRYLTQHASVHTHEKRVPCDVCNKCFKSKHHLTQHMYTHTSEKQFHCDFCKKSFKNKQHLKQHMYTHTVEKQIQCNVCNKYFKNKHHLTKHMHIHTGDNQFECDVCHKCFKSKRYLTQHAYIHTVEKPVQCDVCNKCYKNKQHLTKHMYTHTGKKQFECVVCTKCFKRKHHLKQHMYTHTSK